ncbi:MULTISPECIES: TetR/AcrR family transcriptional regulator [unclassified Micromonospora]|uniref:TetR/AcrR family transcriptional regulator n=1 Tax=unclassified Micromonospora TaxID=2617518 RepID=UPI001C5DFDCD|nr:TetR/AcrR family transcriptional regulator [Micromonospora sp. RL09-050-HVF-A]MBW4700458.1 TetR/AcrR family transcriptional regulator [Micromonospora sp. RL09-050-HVF-A]
MASPRPTSDHPDEAVTDRARRPGGRSAAVRRRVLDAALAQLVQHGYDSLSIDVVAERSGVHRTTVYRRWRDVGGLLADVLNEASVDAWRPPDTGSLEGDLVAANHEVYAALTTDPVTVALIGASFRSDQAAEALRAFWVDRYDRCADITRRAVERGEIPAGTDSRQLLVAATAPLYHELLLLRAASDADLPERVARSVATAARAGAYAHR